MLNPLAQDLYQSKFEKIDHLAIAVKNIDDAIYLFEQVLGFKLKKKLEVRGRKTGMLSAVMEHNGIRFVLCQGTEQESQVSRLVSENGPGVAHIALAVPDVKAVVESLKERGLEFDTDIIDGPGLTQTFTTRCNNTGICFEFINRDPHFDDFDDDNVQKLFDQMEAVDRF